MWSHVNSIFSRENEENLWNFYIFPASQKTRKISWIGENKLISASSRDFFALWTVARWMFLRRPSVMCSVVLSTASISIRNELTFFMDKRCTFRKMYLSFSRAPAIGRKRCDFPRNYFQFMFARQLISFRSPWFELTDFVETLLSRKSSYSFVKITWLSSDLVLWLELFKIFMTEKKFWKFNRKEIILIKLKIVQILLRYHRDKLNVSSNLQFDD